MTSKESSDTPEFKVQKLSPTPSDQAPSPIAKDLRVITHDPENGDDENINSFVPPLDLPLHSKDVMAKYPDVLKMEHDIDDVKRDLHRIYGVYEDNSTIYGPNSDRPIPEVLSDKPINEIVDKYTNTVTRGIDRPILEGHIHPLVWDGRKCPTCNTELRPRSPDIIYRDSSKPSLNTVQRPSGITIPGRRRVYSPATFPNLPPSPTISAALMPHVPSFDLPDVDRPIDLDPRILARLETAPKSPKSVTFNNEVDVQTFTPDPKEIRSGSEKLPNPVDEAERRALAEKQRLILLAAIEADESRSDREGELAKAGYKYDDAMGKLGAKVKALADDADDD